MKNFRTTKIANVIFGVCFACLLIVITFACSDNFSGSLIKDGVKIEPSEKPISPVVTPDSVIVDLAHSVEFANFRKYEEIIGPLVYKKILRLQTHPDEMNEFTKEWVLFLSNPSDLIKSDAIGRKIGVAETKLKQFNYLVVEYQKASKEMVTKYPNLNLKKEQVERLVNLYENRNILKSDGTNSIQGVCVTCPGMNCGECTAATIEGGNGDPDGGNDAGDNGGGGPGTKCKNKVEYDHCVTIAGLKLSVALAGLALGEVLTVGIGTPAVVAAGNIALTLFFIDISECVRNYCP